jgi:hypothetical protein
VARERLISQGRGGAGTLLRTRTGARPPAGSQPGQRVWPPLPCRRPQCRCGNLENLSTRFSLCCLLPSTGSPELYRITDDQGTPAWREPRERAARQRQTERRFSIWPRLICQSLLQIWSCSYWRRAGKSPIFLLHWVFFSIIIFFSLSFLHLVLLSPTCTYHPYSVAQLGNKHVAEVFSPPDASVSPDSRVLSFLSFLSFACPCPLFTRLRLWCCCFGPLSLPIRSERRISQPLPWGGPG